MRRLRTSTRNGRLPGLTARSACSTAVRTFLACGRKTCPSRLSREPRELRTTSVTATCLSRAAIRLETACWLIPSSSAAAWNWPTPATTTNVRSASTSTPSAYFHNCGLCPMRCGLFDRRFRAVMGSAHVHPHGADHVCPYARVRTSCGADRGGDRCDVSTERASVQRQCRSFGTTFRCVRRPTAGIGDDLPAVLHRVRAEHDVRGERLRQSGMHLHGQGRHPHREPSHDRPEGQPRHRRPSAAPGRAPRTSPSPRSSSRTTCGSARPP